MKNLKRIWVVLILLGVSFSSCEDKEKKQLQIKAASLEKELKERDQAYNSIFELVTKIEDQITNIKSRENLIALDKDLSRKGKANAVEDLKQIDQLILQSNETIMDLSEKLENSNLQLGSLRYKLGKLSKELKASKSTLINLQEQLTKKDVEIGSLTAKVGGLNTQVKIQMDSMLRQQLQLAAKTKDLNTAYYIVNSEKKLKEEGLIVKTGGFLSIGTTMEVQPNVTLDQFKEINIKETKKFMIDGTKVELVTDHPSESYQLVREENQVKYLEVLDEEAFWQISKYLIISKKG